MFEVSDLSGPIETLALRDTDAQSVVILAPARGGMVTRFSVGGRDVLYLDETTLRDPSKNVRGGNPVLFPTPGKLNDDHYSRSGKSGSLPQHGFARTRPWSVLAREIDGAAAAVLGLEANAETRAQWDWDFHLAFRYVLRGTTLRIEQTVTNTGADRMPFGVGFHPYFQLAQADKAKTRILTPATRAFDAVRKEVLPVNIELTAPELDLRLVDHGTGPCRLETPSRTIVLSASPEFGHWVLWTLSGKDFVCVEPWTCPANALNSGEHLLELAPGASRTLWLEISLEQ